LEDRVEPFLRQIGLRSFLFADVDDEPFGQVWEDLEEDPVLEPLSKLLGKRLALDQKPVQECQRLGLAFVLDGLRLERLSPEEQPEVSE